MLRQKSSVLDRYTLPCARSRLENVGDKKATREERRCLGGYSDVFRQVGSKCQTLLFHVQVRCIKSPAMMESCEVEKYP